MSTTPTYQDLVNSAFVAGFEVYSSINEGLQHEILTCTKGKHDGEVFLIDSDTLFPFFNRDAIKYWQIIPVPAPVQAIPQITAANIALRAIMNDLPFQPTSDTYDKVEAALEQLQPPAPKPDVNAELLDALKESVELIKRMQDYIHEHNPVQPPSSDLHLFSPSFTKAIDAIRKAEL